MPSSRRTSLCSRTTTLDWRIGYISTFSTPGLGFLASGPPCAKLRNAKCAAAEGASWSATALPEDMVPIGLRAVALAKKLGHVEQINDMAGKSINNALMVQFFSMNDISKNFDISAFTAARGDFTSSIRHEKTSIAY